LITYPLDKAKSALRRLGDDPKVGSTHKAALREIGDALGEAEDRLQALEVVARGLVKKSGLTLQDVKLPAMGAGDHVKSLLRG
jgi:hypothetical protein